MPITNDNGGLASQPLTRLSATPSPSDGERDGVRGFRMIGPFLMGKWYELNEGSSLGLPFAF
jgi:hypothetical protein